MLLDYSRRDQLGAVQHIENLYLNHHNSRFKIACMLKQTALQQRGSKTENFLRNYRKTFEFFIIFNALNVWFSFFFVFKNMEMCYGFLLLILSQMVLKKKIVFFKNYGRREKNSNF